MTVRIRYSHEIDERQLLEHLPAHVYRQGTDRALLVNCRDKSEADGIASDMGALPGVYVEIDGEIRVN